MRQAGRALPEYRLAKGSLSILDAVKDPSLVAELTVQPVRRYGVDAAILFSDIVVPLAAVGLDIRIVPSKGPVLDEPFASEKDLDRLRPLVPGEDLPCLADSVGETIRALSGVPLIGFAGAPFTLACYLVEGGASRDFSATRALLHRAPHVFAELLDRLAGIVLEYLSVQVEAGVHAVQLFDSWVGVLSPYDYAKAVLPATRRVFDDLAARYPSVPRVMFGVGTGELLRLLTSTGASVVGVDWRVPLDEARRRIGPHYAIQGNLDPAACLAPWPVVAEEARRILYQAGSAPGHVFNLGHGVLPGTDPGILAELVSLVHSEGRAGLAGPEQA